MEDNYETKKLKLDESVEDGSLVLSPTEEDEANSKRNQLLEPDSEPDAAAEIEPEDQNAPKSESDPEESDDDTSYTILKMYYKHGEFILDTAYGEQELKDYLIAEILSYRDDDNEQEKNEAYLNTLSCSAVVRMAIRKGSDYRSGQRGYGVAAIIKGEIVAY